MQGVPVRRSGSMAWSGAEMGELHSVLEDIVGAAPFGIAVFDLQLRYLFINDWLAHMNGRSAEDHLGRPVSEVVPELAPQARAVVDAIVRTGKPIIGHEFVGATPLRPGVQRVWMESWYPVHRDGALVNVAAFVEEITDKRNLEARLRETGVQKDRFIAFLSHELRNAVAPAVTALEVVRRTDDEALRERMLDVIERNQRALAVLLDDLLDVARIDRGMFKLTRGPVDLAAVLRSAVESVQLMSRDCRIEVDSEPGVACLIDADEARVRQVLLNLLRNAVAHSRGGDPIVVTLAPADAGFVIKVTDRGEGIAKEDLARIFEPFFTTSTTTRSGGGAGIGLTLSKSIVDAHGGTLVAQSDGPGTGSCFTLWLPG